MYALVRTGQGDYIVPDETSLIPRPSRAALAWRATAVSLAGRAAFVFAIGLALYVPGASLGAAVRPAATFATCVLAFFVAHEAGHLVAARRAGVAAEPPWFLPLGAVMRLREAPPTRSALLDIGAWGPLAGVGALAALLVVRLALGGPMPAEGSLALGTPALWWLVAAPFGGGAPSTSDPVAAAFCLGALVTALNLVPFGQLDGGHVVAALWPARAVAIGWFVTAVLLVAGAWWPGFAVWAAVIHLAGSRWPLRARKEHAAPGPRSRGVAIAVGIAFVLCVLARPFGWV